MMHTTTPFAALGSGLAKEAFLKNTIDGAWNAGKSALQGGKSMLQGATDGAWNATMKPVGQALGQAAGGVGNALAGAGSAAFNALSTPAQGAYGAFKGALNGSSQGLGGAVQGAWDGGYKAVNDASKYTTNQLGKAVGGIGNAAVGAVNAGARLAAAPVAGAYGAATGALGTPPPLTNSQRISAGMPLPQPISKSAFDLLGAGKKLIGMPTQPGLQFNGGKLTQDAAPRSMVDELAGMPAVPGLQFNANNKVPLTQNAPRTDIPTTAGNAIAGMPTTPPLQFNAGGSPPLSQGPATTPTVPRKAMVVPPSAPPAMAAQGGAPTAQELQQFNRAAGNGRGAHFNPHSSADMAALQKMRSMSSRQFAQLPGGIQKTAFAMLEKDAGAGKVLKTVVPSLLHAGEEVLGHGGGQAAAKEMSNVVTSRAAAQAAKMEALRASEAARPGSLANWGSGPSSAVPGAQAEASIPIGSVNAKAKGKGKVTTPLSSGPLTDDGIATSALTNRPGIMDRFRNLDTRVQQGLKYGGGAAAGAGALGLSHHMGYGSGYGTGRTKGVGEGYDSGVDSTIADMAQNQPQPSQSGYFGNLWDAIKGGGGQGQGFNPGLAYERAGRNRSAILQAILKS